MTGLGGVLVVALLCPQTDAERARALVEKLRSDAVDERDDAFRSLLTLGDAAAGELRKAADDKDVEVASRVRRLLRTIELREKTSARLRTAFPGLEERLSLEDDRLWMEAFFAAIQSKDQPVLHDALEPEDADFLVARALRGARTDAQRYQIGRAAAALDLRSAIPEFVTLLRNPNSTARHTGYTGLILLRAVEAAPSILEIMRTDNAALAALAQRTLVELDARAAAPELMNLLDDARPIVRANAAVAVGSLGIREAVPILLRRLPRSEPVDGRSILRALGQIKDPAGVQPLRDWIRARKPGTSQAAEALGEMGAKEAIPDLLPLLETDDADSAATALAQLGAQEAVPGLVRLLKHEDEYTRAEAAAALGRLGAPAAVPALRALLKDPDVMLQAGLALAQLRDAASIAGILDALEGEDDELREEAFEALGRFDLDAASESLVGALKNREKPETVRRAAALLVGRSSRPAAFEALASVAISADDSSEVRMTAIHALGGTASDPGFSAAMKVLTDPDEEVREVAAWTLGRLGRKEAVEALGARLAENVEDDYVRRAAARALGKIRDPRCVPLLLEGLKHKEVLDEVARALGRQGSRDAIPGLLKLLDQDDGTVLDAAAEALARLDREPAAAKLRERLKDSRRAVRGWAAVALCRLGDRTGVPVLLTEARRNPYLPLDRLNALRRPDAWRSLEDRFTSGELLSDSSETHDRLARLIGWPVDAPRTGSLILDGGYERHWDSVVQTLENGLSTPFVIENGRVRVVGRTEGLHFWKAWHQESSK